MRIAIYNFVPPGDPLKRQGGGVAVYQKSLVGELSKQGHHVVSLSSGTEYDIFREQAYLDVDPSGLQASIHNSPIFAPAHFAFYQLDQYVDSDAMDLLARQLRDRCGDIDVFHFMGFEGITIGFVRAIRATFPGSRMIYTAHNYISVCPEVNLWYREHAHCDDFREGRACTNCIFVADRHKAERNIRRLERILARFGTHEGTRLAALLEAVVRSPFKLRRLVASRRVRPATQPHAVTVSNDAKANIYREYRVQNVRMLDEVFDHVLAVSNRTRSVLMENGVPGHRISVSYIGTAFHERLKAASRILSTDGHLHIAYLGYARRDKGFYFFLDCLSLLNETWSDKISVTIAAKVTDPATIERIRGLAYKFRSITMYDGFNHTTFDQVVSGVNLGIIPVLWEDNLPQVAIELVVRGIPILTSDRGGAQEIAQNENFTFSAGSKEDFCARLHKIASGKVRLEDFWRNEPRVFSMQQHVQDLMTYYTREVRPNRVRDEVAQASARRGALPLDPIKGEPLKSLT